MMQFPGSVRPGVALHTGDRHQTRILHRSGVSEAAMVSDGEEVIPRVSVYPADLRRGEVAI